MQTGSRTRYGLGLMVGGRLHRLRKRFGHPKALKALEQKFKTIGKLYLKQLDCGENW